MPASGAANYSDEEESSLLELASSLGGDFSLAQAVRVAAPVALLAAFGTTLYPILANFAVVKSTPYIIGIIVSYGLLTILATVYRVGKKLENQAAIARRLVRLTSDYSDLSELLEQTFQQLDQLMQELDELTSDELTESRADVPRKVRTAAMDLMVQTLREPMEKAILDPGITEHYSPMELRRYLYGLLQFCAMLLDREARPGQIRCELLLKLPPENDFFLPVITYIPRRQGYVAAKPVPPGERPDWLIERFRAARDDLAMHDNCFDCIEDTDKWLSEQGAIPDARYRPDREQRVYVKSILSVVIYVREIQSPSNFRPIGILSFKSPTANALTPDRYLAALPMLRLAYRILGIRLTSVVNNEDLIRKLYGGDPSPTSNPPLDKR